MVVVWYWSINRFILSSHCIYLQYVCVIMATIKDGDTPVSIAAARGYVHVIEFLLVEVKADSNQQNKV